MQECNWDEERALTMLRRFQVGSQRAQRGSAPAAARRRGRQGQRLQLGLANLLRLGLLRLGLGGCCRPCVQVWACTVGSGRS